MIQHATHATVNAPDEAIAIAVDIGGTKIRAAAIDANGRMLVDTRHPAEAAKGGSHVVAVIHRSIAELLAKLDQHKSRIVGIGISSAGVIEPKTGMVTTAADQIPGWKGQALGKIFSDRFGLPVSADNDANCALVGEAWRGGHALSDNANVVMYTLGTGLGGAMMIGGKLITGRHHLTGHFGIARMHDPYTNQDVKVEALVSGTGLGNVYRQFVPDAKDAGSDVMAKVVAGDALANAALRRWCEHLARQIHNMYWMVDPDLIIIGGGMIDSRAQWWPLLMEMLDAQQVTVPLAPATLGNDAGVFGAAREVFVAQNLAHGVRA
jgi:glucokinase